MPVKIYNTIEQIKTDDWNNLSSVIDPDSRYECYWAMEKSQLEGIEFYYAVFYGDEDEIQGILPMYTFKKMPVDIALDNPLTTAVLKASRKLCKNLLKIDLVFAGNPLGEVNRFILKDDLSNDRKTEIAFLLISKMEEFAGSQEIKYLALKDFEDSFHVFENPESTVGRKFHISPSLPNNIIENRWESFDEYLSSLKHSHRRNIKRNIRISIGEHLEIKQVSPGETDFKEIYNLYLNTFNRAKIRFEILNESYFENILKAMKLNSGLFVAVQGGKTIGFLLFFIDSNVLIVKRIGIDYNISHKTLAYFRLFYSAIELGIRQRVKQIVLGQQSYHSKYRWGAKVKPGKIYFRSTGKIMDEILKIVIPHSFSEFKYPERLIK